MNEVQVFFYFGAGLLAFVLSAVFIKCKTYFCNRIRIQRQSTIAGAAQPATSGGFREEVLQTSSSRVEVVVDKVVSGGKGRDGSLSSCTICICEIEDGETCWELTACNHTFHAECIQKWLKKSRTCPLCRTSILVHAL